MQPGVPREHDSARRIQTSPLAYRGSRLHLQINQPLTPAWSGPSILITGERPEKLLWPVLALSLPLSSRSDLPQPGVAPDLDQNLLTTARSVVP